MNPDLCVSVENDKHEKRSSNPNPIDIVHVVIDDSVLPLLEWRFLTRTPKELFDAAMALKAETNTRFSDKKHVKELLEQAAARGYNEVKFQLGKCYFDGYGVPMNTDRGVIDITAAANNKSIDAMMWLGFFFKDGKGGSPKKPKEALEWFRKAMSQAKIDGDTESEVRAREQASMLSCWERLEWEFNERISKKKKKGEEGGKENFHHAFVDAMYLAERGYPNAQSIAGYLLMNGLGVQKNEANAVWYLRAAASKGVTSAMNNYAICLLQGSGCPQSWGDAVMWFERASRLGNTAAKVNLAHCALIGRARANVKQLIEEACKDDDLHAYLTTGICSYQAIGGFPQSNRKAEENLSAARCLGSFHASEAMDWWEHDIVKWCKKPGWNWTVSSGTSVSPSFEPTVKFWWKVHANSIQSAPLPMMRFILLFVSLSDFQTINKMMFFCVFVLLLSFHGQPCA